MTCGTGPGPPNTILYVLETKSYLSCCFFESVFLAAEGDSLQIQLSSELLQGLLS